MRAAAFSFVGLVVGAYLQYLFTSHLESKRHQRELRTQAYLDFLKCVSELAHLNDPSDSQSVIYSLKRLTPRHGFAFTARKKWSGHSLFSRGAAPLLNRLRSERPCRNGFCNAK
jgi:hypothetical protein